VQFDQHRILIRHRSYGEVLDLSLRLIRAYAGPLALALAAGATPFFLFNAWLLADLAQRDFVFGIPTAYMLAVAALVFLETPLATAPALLYLGQAVFTTRPSYPHIARQLAGSLGQLLLYQLLLRPLMLTQPYINQVILLERNPLRSKPQQPKSTYARSVELHRGEGLDALIIGIVTFGLGAALLGSAWGMLFLLRSLLLGDWDALIGKTLARPMFTTYFQLLLWTTVGFTTVVRFLSYLNLRIRREGWDVELLLRAEHARLTKPCA